LPSVKLISLKNLNWEKQATLTCHFDQREKSL
jgi:hypothetical protein